MLRAFRKVFWNHCYCFLIEGVATLSLFLWWSNHIKFDADLSSPHAMKFSLDIERTSPDSLLMDLLPSKKLKLAHGKVTRKLPDKITAAWGELRDFIATIYNATSFFDMPQFCARMFQNKMHSEAKHATCLREGASAAIVRNLSEISIQRGTQIAYITQNLINLSK